MTLSIRPYQREAIDATLNYWSSGGGNPLTVMATGTGKSVVLSTLARELLDRFPDMRMIMLTHVRELVEQNAKALLRTWPQAPLGINSAGLGRRDKRSQVLFASIQSVHKEDAYSIEPRDLVLIDEAHLIPKRGSGMYLSFLERMRRDVPDMRVAGFTATPFRLDSGRLDTGEGAIFTDIVYDYGIARGIGDGFLSPLISKGMATELDVSGVQRRGGEFVAGALEAAVDQDWITRAAVAEMVSYGANRRAWLVFASGVKHAFHLRDEIRSHGISCETVTGETPRAERNRIIRDFREGRIRCLTNASVLTTGFDAPLVDMVAMMRPTLSTGLYVQIVGRGTRLAPGKENCLILDFAGNVRRHGPVDAIEVQRMGGPSEKRESAAEPHQVRAKECPDCKTIVALNARQCPSCGHEWKNEEPPKHEATADAETPILAAAAPVWAKVRSAEMHKHQKPGSVPTLRIDYRCGMAVYRKWVCFEHKPGSFPHRKAAEWWAKMGGDEPAPQSVDEAIQRRAEIWFANEIRIKPAGKYFEVIGERRGMSEVMEAAE